MDLHNLNISHSFFHLLFPMLFQILQQISDHFATIHGSLAIQNQLSGRVVKIADESSVLFVIQESTLDLTVKRNHLNSAISEVFTDEGDIGKNHWIANYRRMLNLHA